MARMPGEPDVAVVAATVEPEIPSSVDWRAVLAGAIVATAISFVLFAFGTGLGLSLTSPYPGEGVSVTAFGIVLALWVLWVTVTSFFAGGYVAGRMRRRVSLSPHEAEVRDGIHGILVWALGVLLGAFIATSTAAGIAQTGANVAATAATGLTAALAKATDPLASMTDTLFRAGPTTATTTQPNAVRGDPRGEAARIFANNAKTGDISADDQTYLAQLVSRETGLSEADAKTRVDTVVKNYHDAVQAARDAAEKARKFTLMLAFLTAATLAVSAAAAWWAATRGGDHRDKARDFSALTRWA
jgi:hypothetical protein